MTDDLRSRRQLRTRIEHRQADIDEYLRHARPRRNALNITSIVCSSLAAAFAAVPAFAGADGMQQAARALGFDGPADVWRPLCFAALIVALAAALAANLHRVQDLPAHVSAAEACRAELESLVTMLDFNELPLPEAAEHYQECIRKIPFVDETKRGTPPPKRRSLVKG